METKTTFLFNAAREFKSEKKNKTYKVVEVLDVKKSDDGTPYIAALSLFVDEIPALCKTMKCMDLFECTVDVELTSAGARVNLKTIDKIVKKAVVDVTALMKV